MAKIDEAVYVSINQKFAQYLERRLDAALANDESSEACVLLSPGELGVIMALLKHNNIQCTFTDDDELEALASSVRAMTRTDKLDTRELDKVLSDFTTYHKAN